MRNPRLTPAKRIGDPRCGSQETSGSPICNRPATWHIAWKLVPWGEFTLLCDKHMQETERTFVVIDKHPAEINCDMPGTGWMTGIPSKCVMEWAEKEI